MSPSIFFFCLGVCNVHFPFFLFLFFSLPRVTERESNDGVTDSICVSCYSIRMPTCYFPSSALLYGSCINVHCAHTHTSHQGIRFLMARYHRANKRRRRRQLFPLCQIKGDDDTNITPTKSINSVCTGKTVTKCSCLSLGSFSS
jgi:hypothetical protein